MNSLQIIFAMALVGLLQGPLVAQDKSSKKQRIASGEADGMIKKLDKDGDGIITPEEVPPEARAVVAKMAKKADLDPNAPIPVAKVRSFIEKKQSKAIKMPKESNSSDSFRFGKDDSESIPAGGFGSDKKEEGDADSNYPSDVTAYADKLIQRYDKDENGQIDNFEWSPLQSTGDPRISDKNGDGSLSRNELSARIAKRWGRKEQVVLEIATAQSKGSASSDKPKQSKDAAANREKVRRYASSLMKQYDKNKNGVLEKNEWSKMRGETRKADQDGNGVITLDELTDRLVDYTQEKQKRKIASKTGSRKRSYYKPSGDWSDDRKSYRFRTATERLPKGLPDWFARNDRNEDGQIAMHEFATSWSDSKLAEFAKYDQNGDGIITATEFLKSQET